MSSSSNDRCKLGLSVHLYEIRQACEKTQELIEKRSLTCVYSFKVQFHINFFCFMPLDIKIEIVHGSYNQGWLKLFYLTSKILLSYIPRKNWNILVLLDFSFDEGHLLICFWPGNDIMHGEFTLELCYNSGHISNPFSSLFYPQRSEDLSPFI